MQMAYYTFCLIEIMYNFQQQKVINAFCHNKILNSTAQMQLN